MQNRNAHAMSRKAPFGCVSRAPAMCGSARISISAAGSLAGAGRTGDRRAMKAQVEAGRGTFMPQVPGRTKTATFRAR